MRILRMIAKNLWFDEETTISTRTNLDDEEVVVIKHNNILIEMCPDSFAIFTTRKLVDEDIYKRKVIGSKNVRCKSYRDLRNMSKTIMILSK